MMRFILPLALYCFMVGAHAERYDVYVHEPVKPNNAALLGSQAVVDPSGWGNDFAEGQSIKKAWNARKERKMHEKAMQELGSLDLSDSNAVMDFARKYPQDIDSLNSVIELKQHLSK